MDKIVIVMPTYNEAENIGRMLDVLCKRELKEIKNHKVEILVVDSNSPDGTADIVREKMKIYKQVSLLSTNKGGLGADYVKGMHHAMNKMKADAIIEMDSDFQHDPKDAKRLIAAYDRGADYVIGSRYIPGGAIPKEWGLHRKLMSFLGSTFARLVLLHFKIHDLTSGLKLTRSEYLKKVDLDNLYSKYYAYKIQILHEVVKLGAKVVEVPIVFHERKEGTSKISRKDLIDSFLVVVRLRMRDSKNLIKFGVVGLIGFAINFGALEFFSGQPISQSLSSHFASGGFLGVLSHSAFWATAIATELAIVSNYLLNNFWTFKEERITNPIKFVTKFFQFNLTSLGAVIIQPYVVTTAVNLFGDTSLVRLIALFVAVVCIVVPYNYSMYNIFIWKRWKVPGLAWIQNRV
jgi:dolichol-phosphate mannosyltransferase